MTQRVQLMSAESSSKGKNFSFDAGQLSDQRTEDQIAFQGRYAISHSPEVARHQIQVTELQNVFMLHYKYGPGTSHFHDYESPILHNFFHHCVVHGQCHSHPSDEESNRNVSYMVQNESEEAARQNMISFNQDQPQCFDSARSSFQSLTFTKSGRSSSERKLFKCPHCLRCFSTSSSLKIHVRTHTGEKPLKCKICGRAFADGSSLAKHRRTHTGEKPYKCSICDLSFSQSGNLKRHMQTQAHQSRLKYKCQSL